MGKNASDSTSDPFYGAMVFRKFLPGPNITKLPSSCTVSHVEEGVTKLVALVLAIKRAERGSNSENSGHRTYRDC